MNYESGIMNYESGIMNKIFKTILISLVVIFGGLFLIVDLVQAENSPLEVEFEKTPLFEEANFLPGDSVTRWVKVTNNSGQSQNIATEAINWPGFPNPEDVPERDLSQVLEITIREKEGSDLYGGSSPTGKKTLFDFYSDGEIYLSNISANNAKEYEFEISFPSEKGNKWQGATTTFDILIGFQGTEGGPPPSPPPGGPGLPRGLTILIESVTTTELTATSVTITWQTNYFSTSKVIYATSSGLFDLSEGEPYYGYTHYKEGDDSGKEKVTAHSVTITDLTPGTTYYYRCVSHGSLAISTEHRFTTLEREKTGEGGIEEGIGEEGEEEITLLPEGGRVLGKETVKEGEGEEKKEKEKKSVVEAKEDKKRLNLAKFLAAIGGLLNLENLWWLLILFLMILIILFLVRKKKRKRKEKEKRN